MDKHIKTKETLPHKETRTKSFTELHSKQHKQAAESSRSRTPTDAAPGTILSKDSHPIKHSENVNSKSEAQPSPRKPSPRHGAASSSRPRKPHTGQRDSRPMQSDLVAPNSGGRRPFHERTKPISRFPFKPTSQFRRGENNASTSNDTPTAAAKLLPVQNRRLLQGGFLDKTVIHNSDGGTVYYKSKEIRSSKDESSDQQGSSTSGQQDSNIETYDLYERRWES
jgi:hypothetical protein